MLAEVRPIVAAADLALCHVETPLSADDTNISGYPVFNTPHEVADADAWAGTTAARPPRTIRSTVASRASGTPSGARRRASRRTRARRAPRPRRGAIDAAPGQGRGGRAPVLHLRHERHPRPVGAPWAVNVISVHRILADARRARAAGATFVVVSLHWGQEFQIGSHRHRSCPRRRHCWPRRTSTSSWGATCTCSSPSPGSATSTSSSAWATWRRTSPPRRACAADRRTARSSACTWSRRAADGSPTASHHRDLLRARVVHGVAGDESAGGPLDAGGAAARLTASLRRTKAIYASLEGHGHDAVVI